MFSFVVDLVKEIFILYYQAAIYILFGFTLAGLIRVFFRSSTIHTYLGKEKYKAIFRSSLFGIPLPLCSCSVLPTAMSLRKSGANKGATTSFLISTPEVGIDSISTDLSPTGQLVLSKASYGSTIFNLIVIILVALNVWRLVVYIRKKVKKKDKKKR